MGLCNPGAPVPHHQSFKATFFFPFQNENSQISESVYLMLQMEVVMLANLLLFLLLQNLSQTLKERLRRFLLGTTLN